MYSYLVEFGNNFAPAKKKELDFFSTYYERGIDYYRTCFPFKSKGFITGEASPQYLLYHKTAKRVFNHYPEAKLIVILRDPIERMISGYNFMNYSNNTKAYDPFSLEYSVKHEKEWYLLDESNKCEFNYAYRYYSYLSKSMYYYLLKRWVNYFDLDQFLFIDFSELKKSTKETIKKVANFLGIELREEFYKTKKFTNYNKSLQKKVELNPLFKKELISRFEENNKKLFNLVGRKFDWKNFK